MECTVDNAQHTHNLLVIVLYLVVQVVLAGLGEAGLLADSRGSQDSGGYSLSGPASSEYKQERGTLW